MFNEYRSIMSAEKQVEVDKVDDNIVEVRRG